MYLCLFPSSSLSRIISVFVSVPVPAPAPVSVTIPIPVPVSVSISVFQVLGREAGFGVLRQQEGHRDARGVAGSEQGLRPEDALQGETIRNIIWCTKNKGCCIQYLEEHLLTISFYTKLA